jgi:sugar phosphate isomerase/epimerase
MPYSFLAIAETDPALLAELGLGVEGAIKANGDVTLPDLAAPYLFSVHLPYSRDGRRFNVGSADDAVRRDAVETVKAAIDRAVGVGARRGIIHPMGLYRWDGSIEATWERTVEGLVEIVDHARTAGLELCLENVVHYWDGIPEELPPEQADRTAVNHIFGCTPAEWLDLWRAIGREELRLCLDTSHAATYAALSGEPQKAARLLDEFLAEPGLIAHVHWSDSWLCDPRGRKDAHLPVGTGTLPHAFHARVKALDATKHLEHKATPEQLRAELAFIQAL